MVAKKRAILISVVLLVGVLVGFLVTPRASVTGSFIGPGPEWTLTESNEKGYNNYWIYTNGEETLKIQLNIFETKGDAALIYDTASTSENINKKSTIFSLVRYQYDPDSAATAGKFNAFHGLRYDEKDDGYFLALGAYAGNTYLDMAYANNNRKYYTGAYTDDLLWLKKMAVDLLYA